MTLTYLATPYNHEERSVMLRRQREAIGAAARLIAAGQRVFSPIAHNIPLIEAAGLKTGWEMWGEFDKDMLSRCDELVVLKMDGWMLSQGVEREVEEAERLGLPIRCLDPRDLPKDERKEAAWRELSKPLPAEIAGGLNQF